MRRVLFAGCTRAVELLMSELDMKSAKRPDPDQVLVDIATTRANTRSTARRAYETALLLPDGLARLRLPGAEVPGVHEAARARSCPGRRWPGGARVPGTSYELDPVQAAFNIGAMIRWLDFNDTWLAAEWGHPSDNLGAILAVADYLSRKAVSRRPASR